MKPTRCPFVYSVFLDPFRKDQWIFEGSRRSKVGPYWRDRTPAGQDYQKYQKKPKQKFVRTISVLLSFRIDTVLKSGFASSRADHFRENNCNLRVLIQSQGIPRSHVI